MRHVFEGNPVARRPGRFIADPSDIDADDDTVELELSPQQMLTLARAADEARTAANEVQTAALSTSSEPQAPSNELKATANEPRAAPSEPVAATRKINVNFGARSQAGTWPLGRVATALGMAAAVIGIGSAAHRAPERISSTPSHEVRAAASSQVVEQEAKTAGVGANEHALGTAGASEPSSPAAGTAQPEGSPDLVVRFKNPFDASEVFEFPPGTSVAEARQSVAEVLLERARDRRSLTREELRRLSENLIAR
jgi:hypothetical protein